MMNRIYNIIESGNWEREIKNRIFLISWVIISAIMGMLIWAVLGRIFLEKIIWMFTFMGYAAFFVGFVGGVMFLYGRHTASN